MTLSLNIQTLQSLASGLPGEVQQALRSVLAAQDKMNSDMAQLVASIGLWTWQRPTSFSNGWKDFSTTLFARFTQLNSGLVVLAGGIVSGTIGSTAFTLPTELCPSQDVNVAVESNSAYGKLVIQPSGAVVPTVGSNAFFAIDCSFLPAGGS